MILKRLLFSLIVLWPGLSLAQKPHIQFMQPYKTNNLTAVSVAFVSGNTCKGCALTMDGENVKVYSTGAFAVKLNLKEGENTFSFKSENVVGESVTRKMSFTYRPKSAPLISSFRIASVSVSPSEKGELLPGDRIDIRIKAQPGNVVSINEALEAHELPKSEAGERGIYQRSYVLKNEDPLLKAPIRVTMRNGKGETTKYTFSHHLSLLDEEEPLIGKTRGRIPYLEFGMGGDRLGGAKINYIDTAVYLHITGKIDNRYRIVLAPRHTAYIPESQVSLLPKGAFIPHSLTGSWKVWGDEKYDYASIHLDKKLPYTTFQKVDPARIVVDIYGATANSNWITQLESAKEIASVQYEQREDEVFRVILSLKHKQHWGYRIYYEGNNLVIRVKRQPVLDLSQWKIAVDAGHGGQNSGARGPTGVYEKTITLQIAKRLQKLLEQEGTEVYMTRTTETTMGMEERILNLRKEDPDLLISIHLNSSGNSVDVEGTSTYYRYLGFRPLSQALLKRMLDLGLHNFGNIGRFNFALNGPVEYPNALVETLFISNPKDEEKALNPDFQEEMAKAIKMGIVDFLQDIQD